MVLSGSRDDADDIVMNNLVELIEAIEFYVGPVHRLVMDAQAVCFCFCFYFYFYFSLFLFIFYLFIFLNYIYFKRIFYLFNY